LGAETLRPKLGYTTSQPLSAEKQAALLERLLKNPIELWLLRFLQQRLKSTLIDIRIVGSSSYGAEATDLDIKLIVPDESSPSVMRYTITEFCRNICISTAFSKAVDAGDLAVYALKAVPDFDLVFIRNAHNERAGNVSLFDSPCISIAKLVEAYSGKNFREDAARILKTLKVTTTQASFQEIKLCQGHCVATNPFNIHFPLFAFGRFLVQYQQDFLLQPGISHLSTRQLASDNPAKKEFMRKIANFLEHFTKTNRQLRAQGLTYLRNLITDSLFLSSEQKTRYQECLDHSLSQESSALSGATVSVQPMPEHLLTLSVPDQTLTFFTLLTDLMRQGLHLPLHKTLFDDFKSLALSLKLEAYKIKQPDKSKNPDYMCRLFDKIRDGIEEISSPQTNQQLIHFVLTIIGQTIPEILAEPALLDFYLALDKRFLAFIQKQPLQDQGAWQALRLKHVTSWAIHRSLRWEAISQTLETLDTWPGFINALAQQTSRATSQSFDGLWQKIYFDYHSKLDNRSFQTVSTKVADIYHRSIFPVRQLEVSAIQSYQAFRRIQEQYQSPLPKFELSYVQDFRALVAQHHPQEAFAFVISEPREDVRTPQIIDFLETIIRHQVNLAPRNSEALKAIADFLYDCCKQADSKLQPQVECFLHNLPVWLTSLRTSSYRTLRPDQFEGSIVFSLILKLTNPAPATFTTILAHAAIEQEIVSLTTLIEQLPRRGAVTVATDLFLAHRKALSEEARLKMLKIFRTQDIAFHRPELATQMQTYLQDQVQTAFSRLAPQAGVKKPRDYNQALTSWQNLTLFESNNAFSFSESASNSTASAVVGAVVNAALNAAVRAIVSPAFSLAFRDRPPFRTAINKHFFEGVDSATDQVTLTRQFLRATQGPVQESCLLAIIPRMDISAFETIISEIKDEELKYRLITRLQEVNAQLPHLEPFCLDIINPTNPDSLSDERLLALWQILYKQDSALSKPSTQTTLCRYQKRLFPLLKAQSPEQLLTITDSLTTCFRAHQDWGNEISILDLAGYIIFEEEVSVTTLQNIQSLIAYCLKNAELASDDSAAAQVFSLSAFVIRCMEKHLNNPTKAAIYQNIFEAILNWLIQKMPRGDKWPATEEVASNFSAIGISLIHISSFKLALSCLSLFPNEPAFSAAKQDIVLSFSNRLKTNKSSCPKKMFQTFCNLMSTWALACMQPTQDLVSFLNMAHSVNILELENPNRAQLISQLERQLQAFFTHNPTFFQVAVLLSLTSTRLKLCLALFTVMPQLKPQPYLNLETVKTFFQAVTQEIMRSEDLEPLRSLQQFLLCVPGGVDIGPQNIRLFLQQIAIDQISQQIDQWAKSEERPKDIVARASALAILEATLLKQACEEPPISRPLQTLLDQTLDVQPWLRHLTVFMDPTPPFFGTVVQDLARLRYLNREYGAASKRPTSITSHLQALAKHCGSNNVLYYQTVIQGLTQNGLIDRLFMYNILKFVRTIYYRTPNAKHISPYLFDAVFDGLITTFEFGGTFRFFNGDTISKAALSVEFEDKRMPSDIDSNIERMLSEKWSPNLRNLVEGFLIQYCAFFPHSPDSDSQFSTNAQEKLRLLSETIYQGSMQEFFQDLKEYAEAEIHLVKHKDIPGGLSAGDQRILYLDEFEEPEIGPMRERLELLCNIGCSPYGFQNSGSVLIETRLDRVLLTDKNSFMGIL